MPMDSNVNASDEVNEHTPIVTDNGDRSYMSTAPANGAFAPPLATMNILGTNSHNDEEDNGMCFSTPLDFLLITNTCFIVPEKQAVVELFFGGYHGTITRPGFYCRTGIGLEQRWVSTDLVTFELGETKVLDARGSPVLISGIVTYYIETARRAAIDVDNPHKFVRDQAPAVLKRIVSKYPYESASEETASLRTETSEISNQMRDELQMRCSAAGVRIVTFNINELSYAPEIAQAMLKRQQAEALISARRAIVQGAKEIAVDAVTEVGDHMQMSAEKRCDLLSNLLVILVGEKDVVPTLQIS